MEYFFAFFGFALGITMPILLVIAGMMIGYKMGDR